MFQRKRMSRCWGCLQIETEVLEVGSWAQIGLATNSILSVGLGLEVIFELARGPKWWAFWISPLRSIGCGKVVKKQIEKHFASDQTSAQIPSARTSTPGPMRKPRTKQTCTLRSCRRRHCYSLPLDALLHLRTWLLPFFARTCFPDPSAFLWAPVDQLPCVQTTSARSLNARLHTLIHRNRTLWWWCGCTKPFCKVCCQLKPVSAAGFGHK